MGVPNDVTEFARLDGCTGERDRLCRFHRHRDLVIIRRKIERQALVRTQISKMVRKERAFQQLHLPVEQDRHSVAQR